MIFSRVLVAAAAIASVIAAQPNTPEAFHPDSVKVTGLEHLPRGQNAYNVAMAKFDNLQDQVADAMAGPKAEREAKFLVITSEALQALKEYNSATKTGLLGISLDLGLDQKGEEIKNIGSAMYHILRSCKGTRSTKLGENIALINNEVDDLGADLASILPELASKILSPFSMYADRLTAIQGAVQAH